MDRKVIWLIVAIEPWRRVSLFKDASEARKGLSSLGGARLSHRGFGSSSNLGVDCAPPGCVRLRDSARATHEKKVRAESDGSTP